MLYEAVYKKAKANNNNNEIHLRKEGVQMVWLILTFNFTISPLIEEVH